MALFRRKQTTTEIPELKEYYDAQKRENPAKAWLLAIISLLLTIGVVLAIFFGGRWLYRTLLDEDTPSNGSNQTANQDTSSTDSAGDSGAGSQEEGGAAHDDESPTTGSSTLPGSNDDEAATTTPSTTPATGALPNTGPGSEE